MSEVSNKTLATLLVVAIVVSLGGTFISLNRLSSIGGPVGITGFQTAGEVNVTITADVTIYAVDDAIEFGEGTVNTTAGNPGYADLWSNGTKEYWLNSSLWMPNPSLADATNTNSDFIIIENQGNIPANVTVSSDKDAGDFIAGISAGGPLFEYWTTDNETGSCEQETYEGNSSSRTTQGTGSSNACQILNASDAKDTIRYYAYIRIPSDASGARQALLTFDSTQSVLS